MLKPLLLVDTASLYLWLRVNATGFQIDYRRLTENLANTINSEDVRIEQWGARQAWITRKGNHTVFKNMLQGFAFDVVMKEGNTMDVELSVSLMQQVREYDSLVLVTANPNLHVAVKVLAEDHQLDTFLVSFPTVLEQPAYASLDCHKVEIERRWFW